MASPVPEVARTCMRGLSRPLKQARPFSSTTRYRKNGPVSVFPSTSNAELDNVLDTLQNTVFMPAHLKTAQRRLVYRKNWQHYLTREEAIRVDLAANHPTRGGDEAEKKTTETFTLRPLNRLRDEPRHVETFNKVMDLVQTTPDSWMHIVPAFLRELHISGRVVQPHQTEKLIRRAAEAGKLGILMNCFQQVDNLGVRISNTAIARKLIIAAHQRAAKAGFGLGGEDATAEALAECRAELDKAIKNVAITMLLIQDRRHVPLGQHDDPKQSPELYGAAMGLIAVRRLLYVRENSSERVAARQEAAGLSATDVSETDASAESKEATAEEVQETASADALSQEEGAQQVVFQLGETDLPQLEEYAARMLELSEQANLEFNAESRNEVQDFLKRWLPVWFSIQVAAKALPANSSLAPRMKAAFDADIEPQVSAALKALEQHNGGYEERTLAAVYRKFLASP